MVVGPASQLVGQVLGGDPEISRFVLQEGVHHTVQTGSNGIVIAQLREFAQRQPVITRFGISRHDVQGHPGENPVHFVEHTVEFGHFLLDRGQFGFVHFGAHPLFADVHEHVVEGLVVAETVVTDPLFLGADAEHFLDIGLVHMDAGDVLPFAGLKQHRQQVGHGVAAQPLVGSLGGLPVLAAGHQTHGFPGEGVQRLGPVVMEHRDQAQVRVVEWRFDRFGPGPECQGGDEDHSEGGPEKFSGILHGTRQDRNHHVAKTSFFLASQRVSSLLR